MEETSPLLSHEPPSAPGTKSPAHFAPYDHHPHRRRATTVIFVSTTLAMLSGSVMGTAQARIFESIYCLKWYREHNPSLIDHGTVEESYCKITRVQSEITFLLGWNGLFEAIPGLFLAVPFGIVSDKFGRRWLLLAYPISLFCRTCFMVLICLLGDKVNLKLIWLGGLFNLFSGGELVASVLYSVVLTDVTPREQLPKIFLYLTAAFAVCFIFGPLIGASLMKLNDWLPVWTGLVMQLLFVLLTLFLPETLRTAKNTGIQTGRRPANGSVDDLSDTQGAPPAHEFDKLKALVSTSLADLRRVFGDWRVVFLAGLLPMRQMSMALEGLQPRYVSYRYHWTIANATYLYSLQALGVMIMLLLVLPRFSDLLRTRWHLTAVQSAAVLTEISLAFSSVGGAVEGIAPTIHLLVAGAMIQTLASGAPAALRALVASLVDPDDTAKAFTGLAIVETLSGMAAGPIVASLYDIGIKRGGGLWLGLPFDVTALIKGTLTIIMCMIKFER